MIPLEPALANATLGQICKQVKGHFLNAENRSRRRVRTPDLLTSGSA